MTVTEVNDVPIANPDNVGTTLEDTPKAISIDNLFENDVLGPSDESWQTFTDIEIEATSDTHGTLELLEGSIIYTPDLDYNGLVSFRYRALDDGTTDEWPDPRNGRTGRRFR